MGLFNSKEDKQLSRFILEPKYREKVILKIHKEEDERYKNNIKSIESETQKLLILKQKEILRIESSRWEVLASGQLKINQTEGKAKINNSEVLFSSIQGAEINIQNGFRIETKDNFNSKKHASVGGAIIGGAVAGPVGAVIGGVGLGKTKTKGSSVSNQIPTCVHMGVLISIDGFISEITILSQQVDQSSFRYSSAYNEAQSIISKLRMVSQTPMPNTFVRADEEKTVKDIDKRIQEEKARLERVINAKPTYKLPAMYRTEEQSFMGDEEYLKYLQEEDVKREKLKAYNKEKQRKTTFEEKRPQREKIETEEVQEIYLQEKVKEKAKLDAMKEKKQENRKLQKEKIQNTANTSVSIIKKVILWAITVFCLIIAIPSVCGAFKGALGFLSGIIMLVLAIMACPFITKKTIQIEKLQMYYKYKKIIVAVLVVIYIVFIMIM